MDDKKLIFGFDNIEEVKKIGYELHKRVSKMPRFEEKLKVVDWYETGFKRINPLLEPFIGVYDGNPVVLPRWYGMAMEEFNEYIDENASEEVKEKLYADVEYYNTHGKLPSNPSHFIKAVEQYNTIEMEHFSKKVFPNGQKISKYLKKVCELTLGKELDHMKSPWAKLLESNGVETGSDLKIVITNSVAAHLGMSLYFEEGRSCQTFTRSENVDYSRHLEGVLHDPNCLILYVTNQREKRDQFAPHSVPSHPTMKQRVIIRLVEVPKEILGNGAFIEAIGNKNLKTKKNSDKTRVGIMIDRSYPDNKYVNEVYELLYRICQENGLELYEPTTGNMSQGGGALSPVKFKREIGDMISYDYEPFYAMYCERLEENCKSKIEELTCGTTCRPKNEEICKACKSTTKLSEEKIDKCSRCTIDECPFEVKNCCQCVYMRGEINVGYKDNSSRQEMKWSVNKKGQIRDRYGVRKVVPV